MGRIKYIDSIKGFAVICVVVGHVANGYLVTGAADGIYHDLFNAIYAFHMPLFFTVSGFLFYQAYGADTGVKREKVKAQIMNLTCIYLLHSILLGVFKILFSPYVNHPTTLADLLLIPIKPIQLYWYLFVLIVYYLVFSREILLRQNSAALMLVTFALGLVSAWIPEYLLFDVKRVLYYYFFFYLGVTLNRRKNIQKKKGLLYFCFPCAVLLYVIFWNHGTNLDSIPFVNQALGILCSVFIFCIFYQYKALGENRFFLLIGKYGLEIYLLHTYVLTACRALFHRLNINSAAIILLVSSAAGVFLPVAISVFCKKIKIYNYLFNPYKSRKQKLKA